MMSVADHALPHKGRAVHNLSSRTIDILPHSASIPPAQDPSAAGRSDTALFFAGVGRCSVTNKGHRGQISISVVPVEGINDDGKTLLTHTGTQRLRPLFCF
jgi:hypothetical protein